MVSERATWNYKCVIIKPVILFLVVLFLLGRSRMKTWHIAALVVVGLIVAGIAYTMYEKRKVGMVRKVGGVGKAQLKTEGIPKTNSGLPGLGNKVEDDRPAGPVFGPDNAPKGLWDPIVGIGF